MTDCPYCTPEPLSQVVAYWKLNVGKFVEQLRECHKALLGLHWQLPEAGALPESEFDALRALWDDHSELLDERLTASAGITDESGPLLAHLESIADRYHAIVRSHYHDPPSDQHTCNVGDVLEFGPCAGCDIDGARYWQEAMVAVHAEVPA